MSSWQQGRRRYGPDCEGVVWQCNGTWYRIIYRTEDNEKYPPGDGPDYSVEIHATHRAPNIRKAQAACDAMAVAWQARFPSLLIVESDEEKGDG